MTYFFLEIEIINLLIVSSINIIRDDSILITCA
jgi:hypothetical protein